MKKSTREQIQELRLKHPEWTNADLARAVKPPVSPQRVGAIVNGTKKHNFQTDKYRAWNRHRYHKANPSTKKRRHCKYCKGVQYDV